MYSFVIYGKPGVGKSTLAAQLPNSVIYDFERGCKFIKHDYKRNVKSLVDFRSMLKEDLTTGQYSVAIIDSVTAIEKLIHKEILAETGARNMATALGGYGNAYKEAVARFSKLHDFLDEHFKIVLYIAHTTTKTAPNPFGDTYEQYSLQLDARLQEYLYTLVDGVYFMTLDMSVVDEKAVMRSDRRVLITHSHEACVCKDRLGLGQKATPDEVLKAIQTI